LPLRLFQYDDLIPLSTNSNLTNGTISSSSTSIISTISSLDNDNFNSETSKLLFDSNTNPITTTILSSLSQSTSSFSSLSQSSLSLASSSSTITTTNSIIIKSSIDEEPLSLSSTNLLSSSATTTSSITIIKPFPLSIDEERYLKLIKKHENIDIKYIKLISKTLNSLIFHIEHLKYGKNLILKIIEYENENELNEKLNESKIIMKINNKNKNINNYICHVYDCFINKNYIYIIMDYYKEGNLDIEIKKYIKLNKIINEEIILQWMIDIISGLEIIHEMKYIHRDIKPLNILFKNSNKINLILIDFGISKEIKDKENINDITISHTSGAGTIEFMAPEQFTSHYSYQIDLWSFGIIFYKLLTLKSLHIPPLQYKDIPNEINKNIPKSYKFYKQYILLLNNLLSQDINKRGTAKDIKQQLQYLLNELTKNTKSINGVFIKQFGAIKTETKTIIQKKSLFNLWNTNTTTFTSTSDISLNFESYPYYIACNDKNVIVSEKYRVHIFSENETKVITIGSGKISKLNGEFDGALGIAIKNDIIYINDFWNKRIQLFSLNGQFISQIKLDNLPFAIKIIDENIL